MQIFNGLTIHNTPMACVADLTPPTFSGVSSIVPQSNGSLLVSWLSASDATAPIIYEIYCLPGIVTAATLFFSTPCLIVRTLSGYVFRDGASALLTDQTYSVGVRAVDAVGNRDSNIIILTALSQGVLTDDLATIAQELVDRNAEFEADHANFLSDIAAYAALYELFQERVIGLTPEPLIGFIEDDNELLGLIEDTEELVGILLEE